MSMSNQKSRADKMANGLFEALRKNPNAVALGKLGGAVGGKATGGKKARAARKNGKLGGRPKKERP